MKRWMIGLSVLLTGLVTGCGAKGTAAAAGNIEIEGLTFVSEMDTEYAEGFQIFYYEDDYSVIRIKDGADYLLVPDGAEVPVKLPEDMVVIQKPLEHIYLVATSAMSMFDTVGALDQIRLSGTKAEDWYVEDAALAMEDGDILYAGKYSAPDYELLVAENCDLALESTMILHNPEVQEKLEEMGIPVFVERSNYETHPLGRTEWLKVYGELTDHPEEAEAAFEEQKGYVTALDDFENTEKTVAFFFVNQNGTVVARKSSDYIPKMIELAGGRYIFEELGDPEKATSGVNLTMEEFYAAAKDADYIVYNASIDNPLTSIDDLLTKSELFGDFKAVQEGNVWTTDRYFYQSSDENGAMISDLHQMLTDDTADQLRFMYRLDFR